MRVAAAVLLGASILFATASSFAQDKAAAKDAYNRGLEAHKRGDHQKAAEEFARADALAPSAVALQAAIDAAIDADDPVLGSELIERSHREPPTPALAASLEAARSKFKGRAGRVKVTCPSACTATIDGAPLDPKNPKWVKAGPHVVVVQLDGDTQTKNVEVAPDRIAEVVATAKAPPASEPAPFVPAEPVKHPVVETPSSSSGGLPPVVFFVGLAATGILGGAATYFAIDTKGKHDDFVKAGCERANENPCAALKNDGESAQTTTNVLIAATAVTGVATAVVGIAFTNWKGPQAAPAPGGAMLSWRTTF